MLTGTVKGKVAVFVVLALLTTAFLSVHYVGLDRFFGGYRVTVDLPQAGGLFKNSEVTYRGVPVGHVESLNATADGAEAIVRINPGAPDMPAKLDVRVVDRSAIGEQYLDLRGGDVTGKTLGDGDHLTVTASGLPPAIDGLLRDGERFVASVPSGSLNTVINETYAMTRGNGQHLSQLVRTSSAFAHTADKNFLVTASLIDNSGKVLATQQASANSFQSFSKDMSLLAHSLSDQDSEWRKLIEQTPAAAKQFDELFATVGQPLGQLMSNLISTSEVFGTNADGVRETMIKLPEGISIAYAIMSSQGLRMGITPTFFNPLPCEQGYGGTTMRAGTDTSAGPPFNTDAGCTLPISSGVDVRRAPGAAPGGSSKARTTTDLTVARDLADLMGGKR